MSFADQCSSMCTYIKEKKDWDFLHNLAFHEKKRTLGFRSFVSRTLRRKQGKQRIAIFVKHYLYILFFHQCNIFVVIKDHCAIFHYCYTCITIFSIPGPQWALTCSGLSIPILSIVSFWHTDHQFSSKYWRVYWSSGIMIMTRSHTAGFI